MTDDFAKRLIAFYNRYCEGAKETMSPIWRDIFNNNHYRLHQALTSKTVADVHQVLATFASSMDVCGLEAHYNFRYDQPKTVEMLKQLARHIGILPLINPEQASPNDNSETDVAWLIKEIEKSLGLELSVPTCLGFGSVRTGGIPWRFAHYCAAAHTLRQFLGFVPDDTLEIGAGFGNLGLILRRWNAATYTVLDLPLVCILSATMLAAACGERHIWFCGEERDFSVFARFYPSTHFAELYWTFNAVYNGDSLPEIPDSVQESYLRLIHRNLRPNGCFLSINHESNAANQRRVYEAVQATKLFRCAARNPHLMRPGYVEEIFRPI